MRRFALGLLLTTSAALAAGEAAAAPPTGTALSGRNLALCPPLAREATGAKPATTRKLGELPPGNLELAVVRQTGECLEPVIIRQGIGGAPSPSNRAKARPSSAKPRSH